MNALALPIRLPEIVEEYDAKVWNASQAIATLQTHINDFLSATVVQGTYSESILTTRLPSEREIKANLLRSAWRYVYKRLDIDKIATAKDKDRFNRDLKDPPAFTIPAIRETFGDYLLRPRFHILRGLAEAFTNLDPAYKSHSKVKIGVAGLPKRVILTSMTSSYSYGRDRFRDMINALAAYQGKPLFEHIEGFLIDRAFRSLEDVTFDGSPILSESGYDKGKVLLEPPARGVTLRPYKNGNAHVIFAPDTLLDINRALAEFYGEVLPDAEDDEPKAKRPGTAVAKDLQYYPTPKKVVDEVLSAAGIYTREQWSRRDDATPLRVLEPSCGCGRFLDEIKQRGARVVGIEIDPGRAEVARRKGHAVVNGNFLEHTPSPDFDVVVMNPPFYGRHYVKHVRHALKFLKPRGTLVAVLPASAHYDHKDLEGQWHDLPVASFSESGTNVPTGYLVMRAA